MAVAPMAVPRVAHRRWCIRGASALLGAIALLRLAGWTCRQASRESIAFAAPADAAVSWPAAKGKERGKGLRADAAQKKKRKSAAPPKRMDGFGEGATSQVARPSVGQFKPPPAEEVLKAEHGDDWEAVQAILKGRRATEPEAMMRARFSALRQKDCVFLAETEEDEFKQQSTEDLLKGWRLTLGLEDKEKDFFSSIFGGGEDNSEYLRNPESFEVIETVGDVVEFKIRCKGGKTYHEKSILKQDDKYGYIYSGESVFDKWVDE